MILTAEMLREGTRCHRIGDYLFLPDFDPFVQNLDRLVRQVARRGCYPARLRELGQAARHSRHARFDLWARIKEEYKHGCYGERMGWRQRYESGDRVPKTDPRWLRGAPRELISYLQWEAGTDSAYGDAFGLYPSCPHTGLRYMVHDDGIVVQTLKAFNLFRLGRIRQLGALEDPLVMRSGGKRRAYRYDHSRYIHSLDVGAIGSVMMSNMAGGLTTEERLHCLVAMLMHDGRIPAHGDGTKLLNPLAFDEDANIRELFKSPGWPALKERWGLS